MAASPAGTGAPGSALEGMARPLPPPIGGQKQTFKDSRDGVLKPRMQKSGPRRRR